MRIIVGTTLALLAGCPALAQSLVSDPAGRVGVLDSRLPEARLNALNAAAFAKPSTKAPVLGLSTRGGRALDVAAADLADGAFATPLANPADGDSASLLDGARYDAGHGVTTRWDVQQFVRPGRGGAVDSVRFSVASPSLIPGLGPRDLASERFNPQAFDLTVTRGWPRAVKFAAGDLAFDFSPHAGVGVGNAGGSAEAGAVVTVGQDLEDRVVDALGGNGVMNGKAFGNRDRWYLFAAASGRAVGLNMLRQEGDWNRAGWSCDPTSSLVGDAQLGVAWRRGAMQTSFGYVHRRIKMKEAVMGLKSQSDSVIALSFSFKPHK